jgi:class 3 adenylate cyclase
MPGRRRATRAEGVALRPANMVVEGEPMDPTTSLPTGTVTFLFTDIEGSVSLWERYPEVMPLALARHDALLRHAIESYGGHVFKTVGDAFCAVFVTAPAALAAALAAQRTLQAESWGDTGSIRVRAALHTGAAEARGGDYFGAPLNRVARLLEAGHGGQILLSAATEELVRDQLPEAVSLLDTDRFRVHEADRLPKCLADVAREVSACL